MLIPKDKDGTLGMMNLAPGVLHLSISSVQQAPRKTRWEHLQLKLGFYSCLD